MTESTGEKQFEATPSRIAKAKREGNTARSQEFGSTLAFTAAACAAFGVAPSIGNLAREAIAAAAQGHVSAGALLALMGYALVPAVAAALAGIAAAVVQSGGINVIAVIPKFERLNPVESLKRMLSRETFTRGARGGGFRHRGCSHHSIDPRYLRSRRDRIFAATYCCGRVER